MGKFDHIRQSYDKAINTIDNLKGSNKSTAEQMQEIESLNKEQETVISRVLNLEIKVKAFSNTVNDKIESVRSINLSYHNMNIYF